MYNNKTISIIVGFYSITQVECDFLTTEAEFEKNYMVQDIFASTEVTIASVVTKPLLPMLRARQVAAPVRFLAKSTSTAVAEDVSLKPRVGYIVSGGVVTDMPEGKQAVDLPTTTGSLVSYGDKKI